MNIRVIYRLFIRVVYSARCICTITICLVKTSENNISFLIRSAVNGELHLWFGGWTGNSHCSLTCGLKRSSVALRSCRAKRERSFSTGRLVASGTEWSAIWQTLPASAQQSALCGYESCPNNQPNITNSCHLDRWTKWTIGTDHVGVCGWRMSTLHKWKWTVAWSNLKSLKLC